MNFVGLYCSNEIDMHLTILIIDVATQSHVYYVEDVTGIGNDEGVEKCMQLAETIYDDMQVVILSTLTPPPDIKVGLGDTEMDLNLYFNLINIWYDEQF